MGHNRTKNTIDNAQTAAPFRARCRWLLGLFVMSVVCLFCSTRQSSAQDNVVDREPIIKGAAVYRFLEYIQWPATAFADDDSPIVIGCYGRDPVGEILQKVAQNRKVGERKLEFKVVSDAEEAATCHVLFVGDDVSRERGQALLAELNGLPILLIGEQPYFTGAGGVFSFQIVNNNLRFKLSVQAATNHKLRISSQLAKLAELVP